MKRLKLIFYVVMILILGSCVSIEMHKTARLSLMSGKMRLPSETGIVNESLPPVEASTKQQNEIWEQYCLGNRTSSDTPMPNYKNENVLDALRKLALIESQSFYFYSGPLTAYGLKNGKVLNDIPADFPEGVQEAFGGRKNAHIFLTLLCGEFRDRPTLIKEKVAWVSHIFKLPITPQEKIDIKKDHVWSKMSAQSYQSFIKTSVGIYNLKKDYGISLGSQDANADFVGPIKLGDYHVELPVEPYSICETKYIFDHYVIPQKEIDSNITYSAYRNDYKKFAKNCTEEDKNYLYDFRGDSNFKPNSPESNAMIWYSSTISASCVRQDGKFKLKDAAKDNFKENPDICEDYFKAPFAHRWTAARAGLATWIFSSRAANEVFSNSESHVIIFPNYSNLGKPFDYTTETILTDKVLREWDENQAEFWKQPDLGFNTIAGLGTKTADKGFTFERLRNAVNRHTDWYASGYDDKVTGKIKTEAYSPFVASSFEMNASDGFTSPGTTVNSPADGCKHWMFVFKIKRDQWYNSRSIEKSVPLDFNRNWFDETSLGTNSLADQERALDRMGTALEGELESILYLNNITQSGEVKENCGSGFKTD